MPNNERVLSKQEILTNVFTKLRFAGLVRSKRDFAAQIDYNYTCLSSALNGEERYLTERLFKRVTKAYPMVNPEYLKSGSGEVLLGDPHVLPDSTNDDTPFCQPPMGETSTEATGGKVDLTTDVDKLINTLQQQGEIIKKAQEQTDKALAQVGQLIEIIKNLTVNASR